MYKMGGWPTGRIYFAFDIGAGVGFYMTLAILMYLANYLPLIGTGGERVRQAGTDSFGKGTCGLILLYCFVAKNHDIQIQPLLILSPLKFLVYVARQLTCYL